MRRFCSRLLVASGVVLLAGTACARDPHRARSYGPMYGPHAFPATPADRALARLDQMRSYRWVDGHERNHFNRARRDLIRFRQRWMQGKFDKDRLNGAIDHLKHLANSRQVHPRERALLASEVNELRRFRASGSFYRPSARY